MAHPDHQTEVVLSVFRKAADYERARLTLVRAKGTPQEVETALARLRAADAVVDAVNHYASFFGRRD